MTVAPPAPHGAMPSVPRLATDLRRSTRRFEVVSDFEPGSSTRASTGRVGSR